MLPRGMAAARGARRVQVQAGIFECPGVALGCWAGLSRYACQKSTHHAPPTNPKREKGTRQPNHPTSKVASSGASAPPVRAPIHIMPLARPRLSGWNHSPIARARAGKGFRRAEEESDDDETLEVPNEPCKPREDRPKSDNPGEHPALPRRSASHPAGISAIP